MKTQIKNLFLLFACWFLSIQAVLAQKKISVLTGSSSSFIYSYSIDTMRNILYYSGNTNGRILGAIDAMTGDSLSWGNFSAGGSDEITQLLFSDDKIYVAGSFNQIKTSMRQNIAVLDTNENVLGWDPGVNGANVVSPVSMAADKKFIYLAEQFSPFLKILSKADGSLLNDFVQIDAAYSSLIKVAAKDSFVFALTESDLLVYKWTYDTLNNPLALKIIASQDLGVYGYYYDPNKYKIRGGGELVIVGNEINVIDDFYYTGLRSGVLKFRWNAFNKTLTPDLSYFVDALSVCYTPSVFPDAPSYLTQPKLNNAAYYDSTLYLGGHELSFMNRDCQGPFAIIKANPFVADSSIAFSQPLLFGNSYYDARQLHTSNSVLYLVSTRQVGSGGNTLTRDYISAHCLKPARPGFLTTYTNSICPEDSSIVYQVPNQVGCTYSWTYNGKGAQIHTTNSNRITMDFSLKPSPGYLTVVATNVCGIKSEPRSFFISVKSPPNANAGPDPELTCGRKSVALAGSSTTANVLFNWKKPDGLKLNVAQPTVDKTGIYILTIRDTQTGCHWRDTAIVTIDTVKPVPLLAVKNYTLNCSTLALSILGKSTGANDTMAWRDFNKSIFANPLQTVKPGHYQFEVYNMYNGCKDTSGVDVQANTSKPVITYANSALELTCKRDTVLLNDTSSQSNFKQFWVIGSDTLANPAKVGIAGLYFLTVKNLSNQCSSSKLVKVSDGKIQPPISAPAPQSITCSSLSVILNGSSLNSNSVLDWQGPGKFLSSNPATVKKPGTYLLTATDTTNGCKNSMTVQVDSKPVLAIQLTPDTSVCKGSSVMLKASPLGGTASYSYTWQKSGSVIGTDSIQSVSAADTAIYSVSISDKGGCFGSDSVRVNVPAPVSMDVTSFQPCDPNKPQGKLQALADKGVPPYQYSLDAVNFQSSPVFNALPFGVYTVTVKDSLGCKQAASAEISATSLLPAPEFLVSTNNMRGDTFVLVDISNPRPDKIFWITPSGAEMLDTNSFAPVFTYNQSDTFVVQMKAYYGNCELLKSKTVYFSPFDSTSKASAGKGIEDLIVYPNPTDGTCTIELKLNAKQTVVLQVFDATGVERWKDVILNTDYHTGSITIPQAENGTYVLKATAEYDVRQKTIIVSK